MSNEIISISQIPAADKTFKNHALNEATRKITSIYSDALKYADAKNRDIASILAKVAINKCYEEDGFKSVADYANQTFGIGKQSAYALASAGKVYNDQNASSAIKEFTPYNLAAISSVPKEVVEKAIKDGRISKTSTQKELKEFAASPKTPDGKGEDAKPEVIPMYTADICGKYIPDNLVEVLVQGHTRDEWDDFFKRYISETTESGIDTVETVKLPMGKIAPTDKKAVLPRCLYFNRHMSLIIEYRVYKPHKEKKSKKKTAEEMSVEELQALLKSKMEEAQGQ